MTWTYKNGWKFKLSIPQSKLSKLIRESNQKTLEKGSQLK